MKTLFVTCYYGKLAGTKFGGRSGREENYLQSFVSLSKMPADFVIYTSAEEKPKLEKFIKENITTNNKITIIEYNLENFELHKKINGILGGFNNLLTDRCFEIQYNKLYWLQNHINEDYDTIYWIDMGLSHLGLWPQKFTFGHDWYTKQFYFNIFNEKVLNNLNAAVTSKNKIFIITLDMIKNRGYQVPELKYYGSNSDKAGQIHVVGGWFGGPKAQLQKVIEDFKLKANTILNSGVLYTEEQVLSVIATEHPEDYMPELFENWYHEDSTGFEHYLKEFKVSFYHIFEKYNG
jgi:hypothetical protein